ncbi:MAG: 50S ribosomal protein L3, partial [Patescibacteria group bacterium]
MKYLVGKKLAMAQVFAASGEVTPVTYVEVTPHSVLSIQTDSAGQPVVLVLSKDKTKANKPQSIAYPELKDGGTITQVPIKSGETPAVGDSWDASAFQVGDLVMAAGVSKGRGFQGVVKRHGFHGHPTTHGHKDQVRKSGSIGAGGVQRVFKGMRMAGGMGNDKVS